MMKKVLLVCMSMLFVFTYSVTKASELTESQGDDSIMVSRVVLIGVPAAPAMEYIQTLQMSAPAGFQESHAPRFVITGKDKKYLFGIGGFVNFRTAYDLGGEVQNQDFVTYDIPMYSTPQTRAGLNMDVSTSRVFFKFLGTKGRLRGFESYIEADFRGFDNTFHLRKAYISYNKWLVGQNVTTFCDLTAAPTTIDFQGPNAYTYGRNLMIRFKTQLCPSFTMAVALEKPILDATYAPGTMAISQRVPDVPVYIQYNFGRMGSHLRASGIFRDLMYYDQVADKNKTQIGWGAQLSGNIYITPRLQTFMQAVYGEGISGYIQDMQGLGWDLIPESAGKMQPMPMGGAFIGAQYNITNNMFVSATYSQTMLYNIDNTTYAPDMYRYAQYVVVNGFYNITSSCQVGLEYLYGVRHNMDNLKNHANRIQAMVLYNF